MQGHLRKKFHKWKETYNYPAKVKYFLPRIRYKNREQRINYKRKIALNKAWVFFYNDKKNTTCFYTLAFLPYIL